jgi:hypothetical protein
MHCNTTGARSTCSLSPAAVASRPMFHSVNAKPYLTSRVSTGYDTAQPATWIKSGSHIPCSTPSLRT